MINVKERATLAGIKAVVHTSEVALAALASDPASPPHVRAEVAATAGRLNAIEQMLDDLTRK